MVPDVYPKTHSSIKQAFVAGGYAVAPALTSDMDIWLVIDQKEDLERVKQHVITYLEDRYGLDRVTRETSAAEEGEWALLDEYETHPRGFFTLKVAKVRVTKSFSWHIMVTTGGVHDVINAFDLSTSQVAIDDRGVVFRGDDYTEPRHAVYVTAPQHRSVTTRDRLLKYMERFDIPGDVAFLQAHEPVTVSEVD